MNHKKLFVSGLCLLAALGAPGKVAAQLLPLHDYKKIATIDVPGGLAAFDIGWADSDNGRYYLAMRTSAGTGLIAVVDTQTLKLVGTIPADTTTGIQFAGTVAGSNVSGPNGVVAIPYLNQLYVGDGDSMTKVVDLAKMSIVASIPTGGKARADELAYDPVDHIVMIANPNESTPFLTFISTDTQKVLGKLNYPRQSGLEQPVWDGQVGRFLISVPASGSSAGSVDRIDPIAMQITERMFTSCSPAGLALGPFQRVMTSCGQVIDGRTGQHIAFSAAGQNGTTIGGDEIWFNPGDNRYYFGNANTGVVDAETNVPLGFLPETNTGNHSIAVDSNTNRIFVPVTLVGIKVFTH
jgi:DNA-binding beta-propeller fold protein YncE